MASKVGLVLLPDRSALRDRVVRALEGSGTELWPVERVHEADYALVDLTESGGETELAALRNTAGGARLALLGVVNPRLFQVRAAASIPVDALVSASQLEAELSWRLKQSRIRQATERSNQEQQRNLSLLLELTARYAESLDVDELLHDVTRRLAETLDIVRASLVLVRGPDVGIVVAASDDPTLKDLRIELQRYPEIRETVRTGQPVIVEDVPNHPLLEGVQQEISAAGIRAIAALPLTVRDEVLGVLLVRASARRPAFSPREVDFLATVAHATAVALRNASLLETVRGQTEREKMARIAAERRAAALGRYEAFFAHVSDGIAILDEDARVLLLNPAGGELLDVVPDRVRGEHIRALTRTPEAMELLELLLAVGEGRVRRDVDLPVRTASGRTLMLSFGGAPLREGEAATILSFRDVTAPRRIATELRQTKEFLEKLIDSSVDAIVAADLSGRVILFNKGAEALTGYTARNALDTLNVRALYPAGVARSLMERLRGEEFGGRGRLSVLRQEIVTQTGETVPVNMTASMLYEGDREVASVGIYTDLRDREQLERKLSDAELRLERSERSAELVALAGAAAHELNQPLTSVLGYAELLTRKLGQSDYSLAKALPKVEIIFREAERMNQIVKKIGRITRFETKSYVGSSEILDLEKAADDE